jgi:hypothetical protein
MVRLSATWAEAGDEKDRTEIAKTEKAGATPARNEEVFKIASVENSRRSHSQTGQGWSSLIRRKRHKKFKIIIQKQ